MALDSNLQIQDQGLFTWTSMIQYILNSCNFSNIWSNCGSSIRNDKKFIKLLKERLQNNYSEMVKKTMNNDQRANSKSKNKLRTYRILKQDHKQEKYLTLIKDPKLRSAVAKMRLSDHRLMIERGRHLKIEIEHRICTKCNLHLLEDELHAVMVCPAFSDKRLALFSDIRRLLTDWDNMNVNEQFKIIMKIDILPINIAIFLKHIMDWEHQQ